MHSVLTGVLSVRSPTGLLTVCATSGFVGESCPGMFESRRPFHKYLRRELYDLPRPGPHKVRSGTAAAQNASQSVVSAVSQVSIDRLSHKGRIEVLQRKPLAKAQMSAGSESMRASTLPVRSLTISDKFAFALRGVDIFVWHIDSIACAWLRSVQGDRLRQFECGIVGAMIQGTSISSPMSLGLLFIVVMPWEGSASSTGEGIGPRTGL